MKYTDKKYYMDEALIKKLELMILKVTKRKLDNLIIIDGDEGFGKTTLSACVGYYFAWRLKRPFSHENFFFDLDKLMEFATNNKKQVIIWDEAALGGMASEWNKDTQKKLIKLLMVARKNQHIWIFNIPRCFKLNEYLIIDRATALLHVYSRDGFNIGRFCYFRNKGLEKLYFDWKRNRNRNYKRHYSIHGTFPNALPDIINEDAYDKMKDEAIRNLSKEPEKKLNQLDKKNLELRWKITKLDIPKTELGRLLNIRRQSLYEWEKIPEQYPELGLK